MKKRNIIIIAVLVIATIIVSVFGSKAFKNNKVTTASESKNEKYLSSLTRPSNNRLFFASVDDTYSYLPSVGSDVLAFDNFDNRGTIDVNFNDITLLARVKDSIYFGCIYKNGTQTTESIPISGLNELMNIIHNGNLRDVCRSSSSTPIAVSPSFSDMAEEIENLKLEARFTDKNNETIYSTILDTNIESTSSNEVRYRLNGDTIHVPMNKIIENGTLSYDGKLNLRLTIANPLTDFMDYYDYSNSGLSGDPMSGVTDFVNIRRNYTTPKTVYLSVDGQKTNYDNRNSIKTRNKEFNLTGNMIGKNLKVGYTLANGTEKEIAITDLGQNIYNRTIDVSSYLGGEYSFVLTKSVFSNHVLFECLGTAIESYVDYGADMPGTNCESSINYKITFDANGGNAVSDVVTVTGEYQGFYYNGTKYLDAGGSSVKKCDFTSDDTVVMHAQFSSGTLPTLPTATRDGDYDFAGWYDAASGGTWYKKGSTVSSDKKLYAHWSQVLPAGYWLTLYKNAGDDDSIVDTFVCLDGVIDKTLPTPTREGYTFVGWFTERTGGTQITQSTKLSRPMYGYAHWTPAVTYYTVTFDTQGLGSVDPITVKAGGTINPLPQLEKSGRCTFGGWTYSDGMFTNTTPVNSNLTVQALWMCTGYVEPDPPTPIILVTITYKLHWNGQEDQYGDAVKGEAAELIKIDRPGYILLGWFTEATGGERIEDGALLYDNTTLHAHWLQVENTTDNTKLAEIINTNGKPITINDLKYNSKYQNVVFKNKDNNNKAITAAVCTGDKFTVNNKTYTIVLVGDVNGDGKFGTVDYTRVWNHLDRKNNIPITNQFEWLAADMNKDNNIKTTDYSKIWTMIQR